MPTFDEARADMSAVLDGEVRPGLLLAPEGVEQLAGWGAALQERCVPVALPRERPLVWCADGGPAEASSAAAAMASAAGANVVLAQTYPVGSFCPSWERLCRALEDRVTVDCLKALLAPTRPTAHIVSVSDADCAERVARALCRLDARRAIVLRPGGAVELCDGDVAHVKLDRPADATHLAGLMLYAAWLAPTPAAGLAAARAAAPARAA